MQVSSPPPNKAGARPDSEFMQHNLVPHTLKSFQNHPMQGHANMLFSATITANGVPLGFKT